jgi:hypothetical protein
MCNGKVEIVIHIDESLSDNQRVTLTSALTEREGIRSAEFCTLRDHLVLVNYDSRRLSSLDVLQLVSGEKVTAQLIGPI